MGSELGHVAFRLGFFITFVSGILLLFLESGTAEQAISIFTFVIGLSVLVVVTVLARWSQRR